MNAASQLTATVSSTGNYTVNSIAYSALTPSGSSNNYLEYLSG
ncbi:MAG: hypothetical protein V9E88_15270 [Ferruginibacter sp.]